MLSALKNFCNSHAALMKEVLYLFFLHMITIYEVGNHRFIVYYARRQQICNII